MTYQEDFTIPVKMLEQIAEQGLDGLPELIGIVVNAAGHRSRVSSRTLPLVCD